MNCIYSKISKRAIAISIDCLLLVPILCIELFIFSRFKNILKYEQYWLLTRGIGIIIGIIYFSYCESSKKQATIGKRIMGIIVTDLQGKRLTMFKAIIRVVIKYIDSIAGVFFNIVYLQNIGYLGYLVALFTLKKQALHDLIAGSIVVDREIQVQQTNILKKWPNVIIIANEKKIINRVI